MKKETKRRDAFIETDFNCVPHCKHQVTKQLSNKDTVKVCTALKGSGKRKNFCSFVGQEPQCRFYKSREKWGKSMIEKVGEYLY